jgi:hypothetical protein
VWAPAPREAGETEGTRPAPPRLDHHPKVAAEIPRDPAYARAELPLRFHAATSAAHSAALRRAAFSRPPPSTGNLVGFAMPEECWMGDGYALRRPVRGLRHAAILEPGERSRKKGARAAHTHKDLREGTRKAAEKSRHKLETRLTKGEKPNRKRMAQVATIYTVAPWVRTPMDILHDLRSVRAVATPRPRPVNKRVWASLVVEPKTVIEETFAEGLKRDPERKRRWVVLVDGNPDQLRAVKKAVRRTGVNVTIILDLIHVLEYFWKAAHCFHKAGSPALEQWVNQRLLALLQGRAAGAFARDFRRWAAWRKLDTDKQKVVDDCIRYLVHNHKLLHYDRALVAGLPLASGAIEGACRYLLQDRLGITGARWSLRGAEAVLKLRALRSSGDFEEYWAFHLAQERIRNHEARYANNQVPGPLWPT